MKSYDAKGAPDPNKDPWVRLVNYLTILFLALIGIHGCEEISKPVKVEVIRIYDEPYSSRSNNTCGF